MRPILIFLAVTLCSLTALGQEKLMMYPTFGGAHFEYEKDTAVYQVTPRQVSQILYTSPDAYSEFKKARRSSTISAIMGTIGAVLVIIPTATAVIGGDPEWAFAAGGAALIIGSIPISTNYRRRTQLAFDMFNEKHTAFRPGIQTQFYVSGTGLRLVFTF